MPEAARVVAIHPQMAWTSSSDSFSQGCSRMYLRRGIAADFNSSQVSSSFCRPGAARRVYPEKSQGARR